MFGRPPVFVAVAAETEPDRPGEWVGVASAVTALLTAFTLLSFSVLLYAFNQSVYDRIVAGDPTTLEQCAPIGAALLGTVGAHELAHVVAARARGV